jgi:predicted TIM-barrel fold metal-dependent hydrolase
MDSLEQCRIECDLVDLPSTPAQRDRWTTAAARLAPWRDRLEGVDVWDIHAHVGCDIDGSRLSATQLVGELDAGGIARAVIFPMNDPRQGFCFEHPNDLIFASYQLYPDRILPFFRLNPNFPTREEYELRVGQGFRGIKLHPRSQSFRIAAPEAMRIYGWAEADGLPVLVHTGQGAQSIVAEVRRVIDEHPRLRLILGHSAAQELPSCCATCASCDWVLFDTSTLDRDQLRQLLQSTEPHKIAYGSDIPFHNDGEDLVQLLEVADEAGVSQESLELILGGNLRRWLDEEPATRGSCALQSGASPAVPGAGVASP